MHRKIDHSRDRSGPYCMLGRVGPEAVRTKPCKSDVDGPLAKLADLPWPQNRYSFLVQKHRPQLAGSPIRVEPRNTPHAEGFSSLGEHTEEILGALRVPVSLGQEQG
jgi:hypothetical protein